MKTRRLRDIEAVPGFDHAGAHIHHADMIKAAKRVLKDRNADLPPMGASHAGVERHIRREAFRQRCLERQRKEAGR